MKQCFELLKDVLFDAFGVASIYFTPPYTDISKIDMGIRASVWTDYNDNKTKIQLAGLSQSSDRLLIIRSNLGFYNVMVFWKTENPTDFISIGPFRNDKLSPDYFTQILKEAHISPALLQQIQYIYESMPFAQVDAIVNVVKHLVGLYIPEYKELTPELIEYAEQKRPIEVHADVIAQNFMEFSEQYLDKLTTFLKYVTCGDNASAKKSLQKFLHETNLTGNRTLRSYKIFLMALNNYCHMALMQTSIHPSHVLRQAATIGTRIEETTSLSKLEQMPNDICHKYCLLVKNYANPQFSKLTKDVIAYIQMHLDEEISLNQLAEYFKKNASFLSHTFSKETGQPLTKFIHQIRIQEALRLFNTTALSVSDVALAVGYQDFSYFSKIFTKQVGCSPRAYRKQRLGTYLN